ncbi:MAG: hypothetical protein AAFV77_12255, partial [Planctomycetota bacterium]
MLRHRAVIAGVAVSIGLATAGLAGGERARAAGAVQAERADPRTGHLDGSVDMRDGAHDALGRALRLLDALYARPRAVELADTSPPPRLPLGPRDEATLEAAEPLADVLTRYRIAVITGQNDKAAKIEPQLVIGIASADQRSRFLFERALGDARIRFGVSEFTRAAHLVCASRS